MNKPFFKKGQVIKTEYPFHIAVRKGETPKEDKKFNLPPHLIAPFCMNEWHVGFLKEYEGCGTGGDWTQYYFYDAMGEQEIVILSIAKMCVTNGLMKQKRIIKQAGQLKEYVLQQSIS